jgi:pyruvate ferredoxin oxidoreductase alpha subunit
VSGPLDIRGDHSDIYYTLNTGWIVLCARDPQAVYDMNFAAVRIGEHADVRLPVIVVYDGFITSHQKRRIQVFDDPQAVKRFLGVRPEFPSPLDTEHPATFGPYMNDPDLINNKVQLSQAMEAARRVIRGAGGARDDDRAQLSGDGRHRMDDADPPSSDQLGRRDREERPTVARPGPQGGRAVAGAVPFPRTRFASSFAAQAATIAIAPIPGGGRHFAGSARGDPEDPRNKTRILSRITAWAGRISTPPTPSSSSSRRSRRPPPARLPSRSPITAPRPASPAAGRSRGFPPSAPRTYRGPWRTCAAWSRPAGSRSSWSRSGR